MHTNLMKIGRRTILAITAFAIVCPAGVMGSDVDNSEMLREAVKNALEQVAANLKKSDETGVRNVALVELRGVQNDYATTELKSILSDAGYQLFTRKDATYNRLLGELGWQDTNSDTIDPETRKEFGEVQGIDALVYGVIREPSFSLFGMHVGVGVYVEIGSVTTLQTWPCRNALGKADIPWRVAIPRFWPQLAFLTLAAVIVLVLVFNVKKIKKFYRPL